MKIHTITRVAALSAAFLLTLLAMALVPASATTQEVRTIDITVTDRGYEPTRIDLTEGEPVRLVFHQEAKSSCAHSVKSDELGLETTELPAGETTTVELTPDESGEFTFACGMGMLKGTLVVKAPPAG